MSKWHFFQIHYSERFYPFIHYFFNILLLDLPNTGEHLFLTDCHYIHGPCLCCLSVKMIFCRTKQNVCHPLFPAAWSAVCLHLDIQDIIIELIVFPIQLRSSFNKAFNKKGSKPTGPYADIEEIATPESSTPSSPKVHNTGDNPVSSIKPFTSASSSG